ncbi:MAG: UDP-N-acetylglucosamine--N-acetylmuramyl-(pentapeptide) pyrophosphoryl-undecaprenol N-acetylglucosamine transferase [Thermoguttaceae bacterium]
MKNRFPHIVFTGGGTLGHLFPGLATAESIARDVPDARITFAGGGKPLELRHVSQAGFEYLALPSRPMPRRPGEAISFVAENLAGYLRAKRFLHEQRVDVVVGLGGYASAPMARAAIRRDVPLVLLEQNSIPGKVTRWLARSATLVCAAMAATRANLRCGCAVRVTGNPVRGRTFPPGVARGGSDKRLLVLGGSGGAKAINENVPRALYKIRSQLDGWQIVHQSGPSGEEDTRRLYGKLAVEAVVVPLIDDVPALLSECRLAVCRAGGGTLAELSSAGVPAVLVPYPHAADDHQAGNARVFSGAGAAICVDGRQLPGRLDDHLAAAMSELLGDARRRERMSAAMRRLSHPEAAAEVAREVLKIAQWRFDWKNHPVAA